MKTTHDLLSEYDRYQSAPAQKAQVTTGEAEVNAHVAHIFNQLFSQLQATFPASIATIREQHQLDEFRRQWTKAFMENGITTMDQVNAGMKLARRQDSPYLPSPGKFVSWCKDGTTVLGIGIEDVMGEFHRYAKEKGLHTGGAERFPWRHSVLYWIVCDTRRAMYQRCLSEAEVEKFAQKKLDEWAKKVAAGEKIPDPVAALEVKTEPMRVNPQPDNRDVGFRYMPNAAMLGSVTPAQWLHQEYLRRRANGIPG